MAVTDQTLLDSVNAAIATLIARTAKRVRLADGTEYEIQDLWKLFELKERLEDRIARASSGGVSYGEFHGA